MIMPIEGAATDAMARGSAMEQSRAVRSDVMRREPRVSEVGNLCAIYNIKQSCVPPLSLSPSLIRSSSTLYTHPLPSPQLAYLPPKKNNNKKKSKKKDSDQRPKRVSSCAPANEHVPGPGGPLTGISFSVSWLFSQSAVFRKHPPPPNRIANQIK